MIKRTLKTLLTISGTLTLITSNVHALKKMEKINSGYRVVNEKGQPNSSIIYQNICSNFYEGRACVKNNGRSYFIDENEKVVSNLYDNIESFPQKNNQDLYFASFSNKTQIISSKKVILEPETNNFQVIGTLKWGNNQSEYWDILDNNNLFRIIIPSNKVFFNVIAQKNKEYIIAKATNSKKYQMFSEITEKEMLKTSYDYIWKANDNYLIVMNDNKYGIVNSSGQELFPTIYETIQFENSDIVVLGNNKLNAAFNLNKKHELISFSEGFSEIKLDKFAKAFIVKSDEGYGFYNLNGSVIAYPTYEEVTSFDEKGIAKVKFQGEWKKMNLNGEILKESPNVF